MDIETQEICLYKQYLLITKDFHFCASVLYQEIAMFAFLISFTSIEVFHNWFYPFIYHVYKNDVLGKNLVGCFGKGYC